MFTCQSLMAVFTDCRTFPSPLLVHSRLAALTPLRSTGSLWLLRICVPTTLRARGMVEAWALAEIVGPPTDVMRIIPPNRQFARLKCRRNRVFIGGAYCISFRRHSGRDQTSSAFRYATLGWVSSQACSTK